MIEAGKKLVESSEIAVLNIVAAFWLYFPEAEEWRLVLVSPKIDQDGPRKLYGQISDILYQDADKKYEIDLVNITLMSPDENIVRVIAGVNKMWDLSGKRLSNSRFAGVFIEDIYIYSVDSSITPLPGSMWFSK